VSTHSFFKFHILLSLLLDQITGNAMDSIVSNNGRGKKTAYGMDEICATVDMRPMVEKVGGDRSFFQITDGEFVTVVHCRKGRSVADVKAWLYLCNPRSVNVQDLEGKQAATSRWHDLLRFPAGHGADTGGALVGSPWYHLPSSAPSPGQATFGGLWSKRVSNPTDHTFIQYGARILS